MKVSKIGTPGFVELNGYGKIAFVDAVLPQMLMITESSIKEAVCGDPRNCVLAKACQAAYGKHFESVIVLKTVIHIIRRMPDGTVQSTRYGLSARLQKAIRNFDKKLGWNLPPGAYMLEVPDDSQRRGGRPNRQDLYGGKGGKKQEGKTVTHDRSRILLAKKAS